MEQTTTKPFKWSASRLKALLLCPRQFRYCTVEGIPAVPTAPLVFGRTMHEVLRWAGEEQMATGVLPSSETMGASLNELWDTALETAPPYFGPRHPTPENYRVIGAHMLQVFHRDYIDKPPPLAVALAFDITIGGQNLVGFIDRVDEGEHGLVVVDYKSGQKKPTPHEAATDVQLTIYALSTRQTLGLPAESVELRFLRDGCHIQTTREPSHFEWLDETLSYAGQTLEHGEFLPRPGYWCRWCDYRELCAAEGIEVSTSQRGDRDGLRR